MMETRRLVASSPHRFSLTRMTASGAQRSRQQQRHAPNPFRSSPGVARSIIGSRCWVVGVVLSVSRFSFGTLGVSTISSRLASLWPQTFSTTSWFTNGARSVNAISQVGMKGDREAAAAVCERLMDRSTTVRRLAAKVLRRLAGEGDAAVREAF